MPAHRPIPKPGEVEPDLEVEQVLRGELSREAFEVLSVDVQPPFHQQFMITGVGANHRRPIDRKVMTNQEGLLFRSEGGGTPLGMLEKEIMNGSGPDFLQLED